MQKEDANSDEPSVVEKKGKDWKHSEGKSEKGGIMNKKHKLPYSPEFKLEGAQ